jgi:hypothetical protein
MNRVESDIINLKMKKTLIIIGLILLAGIFFVLIVVGNELRQWFSSPSEPAPIVVPCDGNPASKIALGRPSRSRTPSEFTTQGGKIFFTASGFLHGGVFDPEQGTTGIYIGSPDNMPVWDPQPDTVSNTLTEFSVPEKEYVSINLDPGRYWLWSSNSVLIELLSCMPDGVSDPFVPEQEPLF